MNKKLIQRYYNQGFFDDKDLAVFVKAGFLTKTEKEEMKKANKVNTV